MTIERLGPKWLQIDLGRFSANLRAIAGRVKPAAVIPVLKANAYGHGMIELARQAERDGVRLAAVATLDEAVALRESFVRMEILLLGAAPAAEIPDLILHRVTPTVCEEAFAVELDKAAAAAGQVVDVHLYADSGMGRMGLPPDKAAAVAGRVAGLPHLRLRAVYSHFPVADETDEESRAFTRRQWETMSAWARSLPGRPMLHLANSGGVLFHDYACADAVRPGLLCYGVSPHSAHRPFAPVAPILSAKCRPLFVKTMEAGLAVGYGREFRLERRSRIMTLPVGYADGIPRRLGPHLRASVRGKSYPVAGRVCMDMLMVDLGDDDAGPEDEVTILGDGAQDIYAWAEHTHTIPYELLTGLGVRWDRLYVNAPGGRQALSSRHSTGHR